MLKFIGKSFCSTKKIDNCEVLGNPASIFILDEDEEFKDINVKEQIIFNKKNNTEQSMPKIGIEEGKNNIPMAVFIKSIKDLKNSYYIRYYQPSGIQAYMCGHGTLVATKILHDKFGLNNVKFYYDLGVYDRRGGKKPKDNLIEVSVEKNDLIMIRMNVYSYKSLIDIKQNEYKIINNNIIDSNIIDDIRKCLNYYDDKNNKHTIEYNNLKDLIVSCEYYDLTFVINDSTLLRICKPDFKKMANILKNTIIRNVCLTTESKENNFDIETRVFCPHDDLDEDKVCGSSNLSITKYWNDINKKEQFNILFPYRIMYNKNEGIDLSADNFKAKEDYNKIGGVQVTSIDNNGIISIGGYCEIIK